MVRPASLSGGLSKANFGCMKQFPLNFIRRGTGGLPIRLKLKWRSTVSSWSSKLISQKRDQKPTRPISENYSCSFRPDKLLVSVIPLHRWPFTHRRSPSSEIRKLIQKSNPFHGETYENMKLRKGFFIATKRVSRSDLPLVTAEDAGLVFRHRGRTVKSTWQEVLIADWCEFIGKR